MDAAGGRCYPGQVVAILAVFVAAGVVMALWGERAGRERPRVAGKLIASAAFVAIGVLRWHPGDAAGAWIVVGLVLCAVGDGLLLLEKGLDAGIVVLLLGHVAYVLDFAQVVSVRQWNLWVLVVVTGLALAAGFWLWPYLGRRRPAVAAYIAVISIMVWGAVSCALTPYLPLATAVGAVAFYLSDLAVARNRFVRRALVNRLVGQPLYYLGQVLIALSVGRTGPALPPIR